MIFETHIDVLPLIVAILYECVQTEDRFACTEALFETKLSLSAYLLQLPEQPRIQDPKEDLYSMTHETDEPIVLGLHFVS